MQNRTQIIKGIITAAALVVAVSGSAHASLTTIGTASYNGGTYNLIWDDNNNGKSLIWLDYTSSGNTWYAQKSWAAGLGSSISSINLKAGYNLTWTDGAWRLPSTVDGPYVWGYTGTTTAGYNITNSELGHLYYTELGNKGYYSTTGAYPQLGWGLQNSGDFGHLQSGWYWSGAAYSAKPGVAWGFGVYFGDQVYSIEGDVLLGMAVRSGQVSFSDDTPTPIPAAAWLLGSGLAGLIGLRRRANKAA